MMTHVSSLGVYSEPAGTDRVGTEPGVELDALYQEHFPFVWRSLRRLGVPEASLDDAAQDVFVVVLRRHADFEGRSSLRSWLFGIAMRVASDHRRAVRRAKKRGLMSASKEDVEAVSDVAAPSPQRPAERAGATRLVHAILESPGDDKRALIVMAELEQMSVPEIAQVLEANVNTVYSRLRTARAAVEQAATRLRAQDQWRQR